MKKFTFILFMVIVLLQSYGQDYLISFTGSGFSSIVDSVWVINLTRNDSLQICGQDTLHLNPSVATIETEAGKHQITVFPNPMGNASTIDFFCQSPGNTHLGIFDVAGKSLIQNVVSFSHLKKSLMKKQSHFRMLIAALLLLPVMLICTNPVTIQGDNQGKHDPFAATQPNTSSPVFSNEVNTDDTDVLSGPAELCLTAYPFEAGTVSAPCCPAPATLDDPTPIPPEGTGTQEDPYLIASLENLYWLSVETNAGNTFSGKFFLQTADIDATETETWFNGLGWEPIGSEINPFSGAYDGNNFTIESLYIKREYESYLGLFGYLNGAWIEKLRLSNADMRGYYYVGALAGTAKYFTDISYVEVVNAQIYISKSYAGGVVGGASYSNLYRCSSSGTVTKGGEDVANWIGGIAGAIGNDTKVEECYSLADITSLTNNNYAGLIGIIWPGGQVKNCYARGDALGTWAISGGFTSSIDNGLVTNSYSTGRVEGDHLYGGFCGLMENGICFDNFWDIETSMQTTSACATGKTTAQMKTQSTFTNAGWDFENVWAMDGVTNDGYPFLKWQTGPYVFAGADATVNCEDSYTLADASASNYSSLLWSTSGDGVFDDPSVLNPTYSPGPEDCENVWVQLCFTVYYIDTITVTVTDCMELKVMTMPEGSGSVDDPYLISSLENLYWVSVETNAGNTFSGKFFLQIADIDATETETWFNGLGWEPIGSEINPFSGAYDGNNFTIESLYIKREYESYLGLFGYLNGAWIEKLRLSNADMTGYYYVGALAGRVVNQTDISYVEVVNAQIYISKSYAGGVVGGASYSNLYRCSSSGTVTKGGEYVANWIGGIAGAISGETLVEECYSTTDVLSELHNSIGGLVGNLWTGAEIKNSYARGRVIGTWAIVGGFAGGNQTGVISNSFSTGMVYAVELYVNGFLGRNVGGYCYNNFWDVETSQQNTDECASGKTTAQMKTQSTFTNAGWDFENVWAMDGVTNDGYPFLKWQTGPQSLYYKELLHTSLGNATLEKVTTEILLADNIGITGSDGFSVDVHDYPSMVEWGMTAALDFNQLPVGANLQIKSTGSHSGMENQNISVANYEKTGDGIHAFVDFTSIGVTSVVANFYIDGTLIQQEIIPAGAFEYDALSGSPELVSVTKSDCYLPGGKTILEDAPGISVSLGEITEIIASWFGSNLIITADAIEFYAYQDYNPKYSYAQIEVTAANFSPLAIVDEYVIEGLTSCFQGFIRDALTNFSIDNATVTALNMVNGTQSYTTPFGSHYSMPVPPGSYDLTCEAEGYESMTAYNMILLENHNTSYTFYLTPTEGQHGYTGVGGVNVNEMRIYPNPGNGTFTIKGAHEKINVRIFNAFDVEVYLRELNLPAKVDLSTQPEGIYLVRIETDKGVFFEKLVIN